MEYYSRIQVTSPTSKSGGLELQINICLDILYSKVRNITVVDLQVKPTAMNECKNPF